MLFSAVLQISTVIVAVLTLVWHQTRTVERLRKEVRADHKHLLKLHQKATRQARKDNDKLRAELTASLTASHDKLRSELTTSHDKLETSYGKLWDAVSANSRKLDRIEGFLGIGMPPPVAARAPGAAFGGSPPGDSPSPSPSPSPSSSSSPAGEGPSGGSEPTEHEGEAAAGTDG